MADAMRQRAGLGEQEQHDQQQMFQRVAHQTLGIRPCSPRRAEKPAALCRRIPPHDSNRSACGGRRDKAAFPPYRG
jgi:hypothetical protein